MIARKVLYLILISISTALTAMDTAFTDRMQQIDHSALTKILVSGYDQEINNALVERLCSYLGVVNMVHFSCDGIDEKTAEATWGALSSSSEKNKCALILRQPEALFGPNKDIDEKLSLFLNLNIYLSGIVQKPLVIVALIDDAKRLSPYFLAKFKIIINMVDDKENDPKNLLQ
jgi:hypothetical protein